MCFDSVNTKQMSDIMPRKTRTHATARYIHRGIIILPLWYIKASTNGDSKYALPESAAVCITSIYITCPSLNRAFVSSKSV